MSAYTLVLRSTTIEPDLQMRYYTILLLIFDVVQVHSFALPGVVTKELYVGGLSLTIFRRDKFNRRCIALDPVIRLVGGISLWSVEIIMQLRVYALFDRNKKVEINFVFCRM